MRMCRTSVDGWTCYPSQMTDNDQATRWSIYKFQLRGAPPNKGYIGLTVNLAVRDLSHQMAAFADGSWRKSNAWAKALREYKREAFDLVVLETHSTEEAAHAAERRLIAEHKTHVSHGGYNADHGWIRHRTFSPPRVVEHLERQAKRKAKREAKGEANRERRELAAARRAEMLAARKKARRDAEEEAREKAERRATEIAARKVAKREKAEQHAAEVTARKVARHEKAEHRREQHATEVAAREVARRDAEEEARREKREAAAHEEPVNWFVAGPVKGPVEGPVELERAVEVFGSYTALARHLNLSLSTVHGWARRKSLPLWRAKEIIAARESVAGRPA